MPKFPRPLGAWDRMGVLPESHTQVHPRQLLQHLSSSQPDARSKPRPAQVWTTGDPAATAHLPQVICCLPSSAFAAFLP